MTSNEPEFQIDQHYLYHILKEIIEINSVVGNEKELALFLAQELHKLGLAIQLEDVEPNRPNVYAHHSFSKHGKTLTLNCHLDTVDICNGWTSDPFSPYERDGKLFGLGSCDMKAGIACELATIKALIECNEKLAGQIHFTAVIDEEGYGKGAKKQLENPFFGKGRTDGILIAEPFFGDDKVHSLPLGMTGKILYKILVQGKSAHAFKPHEGVNAIEDASVAVTQLIEEIKNISPKTFSLPKDSDFGEGTICFLKIDGGYKIYSVVVPDSCELILNRLLVPGETKKSAEEDLQTFISTLNLSSKVTIEIIPPFYLPYKIDYQQPLVKALKRSYVKIINYEPYFSFERMITDANIFAGEGNIPTMIFGPKGGNIHSANEFVEVKRLEKVAKIFCQTFFEYQKNI